MLALVFSVIDVESLKNTIARISPLAALSVVLGYLAGQLISAFKWCTIARASGIKTSYLATLRAYYIGTFVNCFGLGMVGGDVARGVLIAKGQPKKLGGIATVIADRVHGLAVLAAIGTVSVAIFGRHNLDPWLSYLLLFVGGSVLLGWFFGPRILLMLVPEGARLRDKAEEISAAFPKDYRIVLLITGLSIIFHLSQIFLHWLMAIAVSAEIPWNYLLVAVPFVNICASLPISWNGLGVRENAYIFFFFPAMLSREQAFAFGTLWLLSVIVSSSIGGIIAFLTDDFSFVKKKDDEAFGEN